MVLHRQSVSSTVSDCVHWCWTRYWWHWLIGCWSVQWILCSSLLVGQLAGFISTCSRLSDTRNGKTTKRTRAKKGRELREVRARSLLSSIAIFSTSAVNYRISSLPAISEPGALSNTSKSSFIQCLFFAPTAQAMHAWDARENSQYIFFQRAVNIMQYCRLKIAISL